MKNEKDQTTDELTDGLEEVTSTDVVETAEEKTARVRKEQTAEEKEILVAGAEKLKTLGISPRLASMLVLAIDWNSDKETLATAKESIIKEFGSSDLLKNFVDDEFQKELLPFQGIAKLMPVLNNIKSFYARRENAGTKKVKYVQASIGGVMYNVDSAYIAEIANLPVAERKALILAHPATSKMDVIEEIL